MTGVKSLTKTVSGWAGAGAIRGRPLANSLTQVVDWAYGKAVSGLPGFEGAEALAAEYAARHPSVDEAVKALIARHSRMAAVAGLVTGCGGFVALPLALPANVAGTLYLQTRLITAIAHLHGHDIHHPRVRMLVLACLSGSKAADTLRDAGIRFGTRLGRDAIGWAAPALFNKSRHAGHLAALSGAVGSRGIAGLGRFVPLLGGAVAAGFDGALTQMIGRTADRVFASLPDADTAETDELEAVVADQGSRH